MNKTTSRFLVFQTKQSNEMWKKKKTSGMFFCLCSLFPSILASSPIQFISPTCTAFPQRHKPPLYLSHVKYLTQVSWLHFFGWFMEAHWAQNAMLCKLGKDTDIYFGAVLTQNKPVTCSHLFKRTGLKEHPVKGVLHRSAPWHAISYTSFS